MREFKKGDIVITRDGEEGIIKNVIYTSDELSEVTLFGTRVISRTNTKFSYYEVEIDSKVYPFTGGLKLIKEVV